MLEDNMFNDSLRAMGVKRTKDMYEESTYPHLCSMCLEKKTMSGYKLKPEYVECLNTPYLFVCEDCLKELPKE